MKFEFALESYRSSVRDVVIGLDYYYDEENKEKLLSKNSNFIYFKNNNNDDVAVYDLKNSKFSEYRFGGKDETMPYATTYFSGGLIRTEYIGKTRLELFNDHIDLVMDDTHVTICESLENMSLVSKIDSIKCMGEKLRFNQSNKKKYGLTK